MKKKSIFFDFGGTLAHLYPSREQVFYNVCAGLGIETDLKKIRDAYFYVEFFNKYSSVNIKNISQKKDFYAKYNQQLCYLLGIETKYKEINKRLFKSFKNSEWILFDDTVKSLKTLKTKNLFIGLISNWDANLPYLLKSYNIENYFDDIAVSKTVGFEKPDVNFYKYVLKKNKNILKYKEKYYVGDDYILDVVPSRKAGMIPIIIDRIKMFPKKADCLIFESVEKFVSFYLKQMEQ